MELVLKPGKHVGSRIGSSPIRPRPEERVEAYRVETNFASDEMYRKCKLFQSKQEYAKSCTILGSMNCTVACAQPEGWAIYPDTFAAVNSLLSKRCGRLSGVRFR